MCSRHDMNEIMLNLALSKNQSFLCNSTRFSLLQLSCAAASVEGIQYHTEAEQALTKIFRLLKAVSIWLLRY